MKAPTVVGVFQTISKINRQQTAVFSFQRFPVILRLFQRPPEISIRVEPCLSILRDNQSFSDVQRLSDFSGIPRNLVKNEAKVSQFQYRPEVFSSDISCFSTENR